MEKEISSGTMLGIVLIALAAVIGLGFGVFSIAKGVANEGTVGVQDNLGTVSESAFEDYNDKIVTGTMVKSAVTNFAGKSVAILIDTTAMNKEVKPYASHKSLQCYVIGDDGKMTTGDFFAKEGSASNLGTSPSQEKYYVNYNALFGTTASTDADGKTTVTWDATGTMALKDGVYQADGMSFAVDSTTGKVQYDNSVGGFSRTGNCEYLAATAKFDANLIKDTSGTTIGIVFTQRAK